MASAEIRKEIVERVIARRGKLHLFDSLDPKKTALLVIDMQNAFVAPESRAKAAAALTHEEQRATLENMIQQFGDVLTADEALSLFGRQTARL